MLPYLDGNPRLTKGYWNSLIDCFVANATSVQWHAACNTRAALLLSPFVLTHYAPLSLFLRFLSLSLFFLSVYLHFSRFLSLSNSSSLFRSPYFSSFLLCIKTSSAPESTCIASPLQHSSSIARTAETPGSSTSRRRSQGGRPRVSLQQAHERTQI